MLCTCPLGVPTGSLYDSVIVFHRFVDLLFFSIVDNCQCKPVFIVYKVCKKCRVSYF